ncbi:chemosensory receptor A [Elysia marginata]|uniref:Chemosensory receptor A n=1 Tax=Elysia marginata TaxID=1093978 RepID=A0AAV4JNZ7_9GAST|nr:chemosensory receptor A [Elysia marginata]
MPLHFKSTFSRNRTVLGIICLFCLSVLFHLPVLTIFSIGWREDPNTNSSRPVLVASARQSMVKINDLLNRNALPWILFITMIACVALLCFKLFEASKVHSLLIRNAKAPGEATASTKGSEDNSRLSPKDVHVVQSVVLVCSIFIVAQLPALLYSTVRVVNPDFDHGGRLVRLFGIFANVSLTFSLLNATLNICVYYNYNSKYRSIFRSFLKLKD